MLLFCPQTCKTSHFDTLRDSFLDYFLTLRILFICSFNCYNVVGGFIPFKPRTVTFLGLDFHKLLLFFHAALKFQYDFKFILHYMLQTGLVCRDSTGPCETSQIRAAKLKFKLPLKAGNLIKLSKRVYG